MRSAKPFNALFQNAVRTYILQLDFNVPFVKKSITSGENILIGKLMVIDWKGAKNVLGTLDNTQLNNKEKEEDYSRIPGVGCSKAG